jgi:DNA-binding NarL/FixJ family response regulator
LRRRRKSDTGYLDRVKAALQRHLTSINPGQLLADMQLRLSPRERTVLLAFLTDPDVGRVTEVLQSNEHTIRNQLASIRKKLRVRTATELLVKVISAVHWHENERRPRGGAQAIAPSRQNP